MNTLKKLTTIIFLLIAQVGFAQIKNATTETVKIYGNCGICEKAIEKAGSSKKEAMVDWDKDTKMATITYNTKKTDLDEILKRIALAGYDSDSYLAPKASYDKLAQCCQYDRTAMNEPILEKKAMDHASMGHPVNVSTEGKPAMDHAATSHSMNGTSAANDNPLKRVFDHYFDLKDALVASDPAKAAEHAGMLHTSLSEVEMNKLTDNSHKAWIKTMKPLVQNAKATADVNDIKKQRKTFIDLSADMYELMRSTDVGAPVYVQFCPMANNGEGAKWLSKESAVKNPYYGSMMLTCGSVKETIE